MQPDAAGLTNDINIYVFTSTSRSQQMWPHVAISKQDFRSIWKFQRFSRRNG